MTMSDNLGEGQPDPAPRRLFLVSDDLLFPSRIREALKPLGHALQVGATLTSVRDALAGAAPPETILVNLNSRRGDPLALIHALKSDPATRNVPLLAFAGHVETAKHQAAREAGADLTAANSSVSLHLPKLLGRLLSGDLGPVDLLEESDDER